MLVLAVRERFRTYTIHRVLGQPTIFRATEQISLIRAAWNTYARPTVLGDRTRGDREGEGLRRTPPPPTPPFGQFLFIAVSPLRSFNSRFSWSRLVIAVESSVNQGTACKRLDRGETLLMGSGLISRKDSLEQLRGGKRMIPISFEYIDFVDFFFFGKLFMRGLIKICF